MSRLSLAGLVPLVCAAFAVPGRAGAAPPVMDLVQWMAPESCPSKADALSRVARLVGDGSAHSLTARVKIVEQADGFVAHVGAAPTLASYSREVHASTCDLVVDAVALILAMSLTAPSLHAEAASPSSPAPSADGEPTSVNEKVANEVRSSPSPSSPASPPLRGSSVPNAGADGSGEPSRPSDARERLGVGLTVGSLLGPLPSPAAAVGGHLEWRPLPRLRAEFGGLYGFAQTTTLSAGPGGHFALLVFNARACLPIGRSLEIAPCVGVTVSRLRGDGVDVAAPRQADAWWWGPESGLTVRIRVNKHLAIRGAALASLPLALRRFVIDGAGTVHQPSSFELFVGIGPEAIF